MFLYLVNSVLILVYSCRTISEWIIESGYLVYSGPACHLIDSSFYNWSDDACDRCFLKKNAVYSPESVVEKELYIYIYIYIYKVFPDMGLIRRTSQTKMKYIE